jgi:diamine N-acetyltransferase
MIIQIKNNRLIELRKLDSEDFSSLSYYLSQLSPETVKWFGPHGFDMASIVELYKNSGIYFAYLAIDTEKSEIIAYSIIKRGYLEHDSFRLQSYGLTLNANTDCTFAPSVADAWQSLGVGNSMFRFILSDLKSAHFKRIILWGGVQADNCRAVNYYKKNGFLELGEFEYTGRNYDMILDIV